MIETLSVFQWSILALAALCIGMSNLAEPPDARIGHVDSNLL